MKRQAFLTMLGSLAFFPSSLGAKRPKQEGEMESLSPVEPIGALDEILHQLAGEYGAKVETCTGEGYSHSRTIKAVKVPGQFGGKEWWLCLHIQTTRQHALVGGQYELTCATLNVVNQNPISIYTSDVLSGFIGSGGGRCGNGDFGINIRVKTCTTEDARVTRPVFADIDVHRRFDHMNEIHPLHKRVIPLFWEMTSNYSCG